jgi:hypothetical protein
MQYRIGQKADIREQTSPEGEREWLHATDPVRIDDLRIHPDISITRASAIVAIAALLGALVLLCRPEEKPQTLGGRDSFAKRIAAVLGGK